MDRLYEESLESCAKGLLPRHILEYLKGRNS